MDKELDRITKNPDTDIVIRIDEYLGKKGLTIREFVKSERYTGFTKAGTRIPADKFKVFKQIINSIDEKELEEAAQEQASQSAEKSHKPKDTNPQKKQESLDEVEF